MLLLSPLVVCFLPVGEVDAHGAVGGAKTGKVRVKGSGAFVFFFIWVFMLIDILALILILLEPLATSSSSLHIRPLQLGFFVINVPAETLRGGCEVNGEP